MTTVPTYVVDASVVVKWFTPEVHLEHADVLLRAAQAGTAELAAPELMLLEVGNACWKRVCRGEMLAEQALAAVHRLAGSFLELVPVADLAAAGLGLALATGCSVYDATYLALAEAMSAPLVTDDRRLHALCARTGVAGRVLLISELKL